MHTSHTALEKVTFRDVLETVSDISGVSIDEIKGKSRLRHISYARHAAWYAARKLTGLSLLQLGRMTGQRDHTTVMHGILMTKRDRKDAIRNREVFSRRVTWADEAIKRLRARTQFVEIAYGEGAVC